MASMTGTEFPGATVPDPTGAVTIGDYLTAFQTVTGLSAWMFYDTSTGTSGTAEAWDIFDSGVAHSGYVFTSVGHSGAPQKGILRRYNPATGAFTGISHWSAGPFFPPPLVAYGDWIVSYTRLYKPSTDTHQAWTNGKRAMGVTGGRLFTADANTVTEVDPVTDTVVDTWTGGWSRNVTTAQSQAAVIGSTLWWPVDYATAFGVLAVGFDASTETQIEVVATPGGPPEAVASTRDWCPGPDGYLYRLIDTNTMLVTDPDSGHWATPSLPTSRARRYRVVTDGTHLWVPTGGV